MAKTSYLGSNVETQDTFAGWLEQTNKMIYDMGSVVMTVADVAEPNTTNGAWATGNTQLEGIFSANTVSVGTSIRGGNVQTSATLTISSNATFSGANVHVNANTNLNGSNVNVTANSTVFTSNTVIFNLGSSGNTVVNTGVFFVKSNTSIQGAVANVHTTTLNVTSNTTFTAETLFIDTTNTTIGSDSTTDTLTVESITQFNANVHFADDVTLALGVGNDLKLYHDGSDSYIDDTGTGDMYIRAADNLWLQKYTGETMLKGIADGAVELYYNNAKKLSTANDGVDITGTLDVSTNQTIGGTLAVTGVATFNANVDLQDSDRLLIGTGDDLQVYHDGSHSYISDVGTGDLKISGSTVRILGVDDGAQDTMAVFTDNAAVELYYNSNKKLETVTGGVLVTGELESTTLDVNGVADILGASTFANTVAVTGAVTLSNTFFVTGQSNVSSIMVRDLTATRVPYVGTGGEIQDNAALAFHFANTTLATANVAVTGSVLISDDLVVVDNVDIDGQLDVGDDTASTSSTTGSIVTAGGLGVAKDAWFGTGVNIDVSDGIYFENKKHGLTFNDGSGNFNLRVGNIRGSSGEESTEAGYAFHQEYSQSAGWNAFQVSSTSLSVGDTPTWRAQIWYDYDTVKLRYRNADRLVTDTNGVIVTGKVEASGNVVSSGTLIAPRLRGGANEADAITVQTNMDVMGTTRFGTPSDAQETVGFYNSVAFFNDITLANNSFQMSVANAVITDLTILGSVDMDLAKITSDFIPNTTLDEVSLGNNANTDQIFTNVAARGFSFDADIADTNNLGLIAYIDGDGDPNINYNTSTNKWQFDNGAGTAYQVTGKIITSTTDVIKVNGGSNSSNTEITINHGVPAAGVPANSAINVNASNGTVIQDLDLDFDAYGHVVNASVATYNLDNRYYTETESDNRFVNVTGDTMTGKLILKNTAAASNSKAALLEVQGDTYSLGIFNKDAGEYSILSSEQNNGIEIYPDAGGVRILYNDNYRATFDSTDITLSVKTTIEANTTIEGDLIISDGGPRIDLRNTGAVAQHYIYSAANNFYVLANRWDADAGDWVENPNTSSPWQGPNPLLLETDNSVGYLYGDRILTVADEGHGNGIDADTTDGLHANTSNVANTLVARDSNRNFSANNVTFNKVTGTEFVATSSAGLAWENGVSRITNNDGGGNAQIRWGHDYSSSATRFTHAGSAIYVGGNIDSANAYLDLVVASNGGAGNDEEVTFGNRLRIYHNLITWDNDRILTVADEGSGNGLDADTVDGIQASSFLRSDANDLFQGTGYGSYLRLYDNRELQFGNGGDWGIYYDEGADASFPQYAGQNDLIFYSTTTTAKDIRFGYIYDSDSDGTNDAIKTKFFFDMGTGSQTIGGNLVLGGDNGATSDSYISFWDTGNNGARTPQARILRWDTSAGDWAAEASNGSTYKIWHAGNDGAGSGLHADEVDGYHGSELFVLAENETVTGNTTFSGITTFSKYPRISVAGTASASKIMADFAGDSDALRIWNHSAGDYKIGNSGQDNSIEFYNGTGGVRIIYNGANSATFDSSDIGFHSEVRVTGGNDLKVTGDVYVGSSGQGDSTIYFHDDNSNVDRKLTWDNSENKFRAELNDGTMVDLVTSADYGSGSGIDADKVDGIHASSFLRSDANDIKTGGNTTYNDSRYLRFGSDGDAYLFHNNANFFNVNTTGSHYFRNTGNWYFQDADASNATRVTIASSTGNITTVGDLSAVDGIFSGNVTATGDLTAQDDIWVGRGGNGDSKIHFHDDNTNTWRSFGWYDDENTWYVEDNGGTNRMVYHTGNWGTVNDTWSADWLRFEDNKELRFGSGSDLVIYLDEVTRNQMILASRNNRDLAIYDEFGTAVTAQGAGTKRFLFDISAGHFYANGNIVAYHDNSDARLKDNVVTIDNALDKVKEMRGVTFNYKANPDERLSGVIAQEVEPVTEGIVFDITDKETGESTKAVRYDKIVAYLIEAVKEQQEQIEELKAEVEKLRGN